MPLWLEIEGGRVDAVSQPTRLGTIGEHVTQVGSAIPAASLNALHTQAVVDDSFDIGAVGRLEETRPAGPGLILGLAIT